MGDRMYHFVGPKHLLERVHELESGRTVTMAEDFAAFAPADRSPSTLTFIISQGGALRVDERGTEHVVCAGGEAMLAAGELTLQRVGASFEVIAVTNQSAGYCPEPES